MKQLLALAILLTAFTASSEVLVYKQKYTVTETGSGSVSPYKYSGYFIVDTDSGRFISLDARANTFPLGKNKMRVTEYTDWTFETVDGGAIKDYWTITGNIPGATVSAPLLKGLVSTMVDVGTHNGLFNWMDIPKLLTLSGFSKFQISTQTVLCEYKGNFTLDLKTTQAQNRVGNDADAALGALKSTLGSQGYVLVENWND